MRFDWRPRDRAVPVSALFALDLIAAAEARERFGTSPIEDAPLPPRSRRRAPAKESLSYAAREVCIMPMEKLRGRSMSVHLVGDVLLVVHAKTEIDPSEWRTFCAIAGKARKERGSLRSLVISAGGAAPNAAQRAQYKDEVGSTLNRVAVVTDSVAARTVLTAMSWFNAEMKPFALDDITGALAYLEVKDGPALRDAIAELRAHLGLEPSR